MHLSMLNLDGSVLCIPSFLLDNVCGAGTPPRARARTHLSAHLPLLGALWGAFSFNSSTTACAFCTARTFCFLFLHLGSFKGQLIETTVGSSATTQKKGVFETSSMVEGQRVEGFSSAKYRLQDAWIRRAGVRFCGQDRRQ
jgi:hypothetical protein